jgi:16S rRNA (uracil1498-N3)-methyltransferase
MRRPRFHTEQTLSAGALLTLEAEPSRHIARVLRLQIGDDLSVFDGRGAEARARLRSIARDRVEVELETVESIDRESPLAVTLAIGLSRGDRMDTVIQKATELGVKAIWPMSSERSGVRLDGARLAKKRGHWRRVAISACEQCGRNRLPEIGELATMSQLFERSAALGADTLRLLLHPEDTGSADAAAELPQRAASLVLLAGPEGGFSGAEVEAALGAGFRSLQLGPRILRTETAPLAALAVAQARWGDFLSLGRRTEIAGAGLPVP